MTVVDSSVLVDLLRRDGVWRQARELFETPAPNAAPDIVVFEVMAALRRDVLRESLSDSRAAGALEDLGDLRIGLFPSMPLRGRAWELRHNLTAADALFTALAERLGEPLATKDRRLAAAAREHTDIEVIALIAEAE